MHGNPSMNPVLNPNVIIDVEDWCKSYVLHGCEKDALTCVSISTYQVGQAISTSAPAFTREAVGASIVHMLAALIKLGGSVSHLLPQYFTELECAVDSHSLLLCLCKITQQVFYEKYTAPNSYRRKRYSLPVLEELVANFIQCIAAFTPRQRIAEGIVHATSILTAKAYKE